MNHLTLHPWFGLVPSFWLQTKCVPSTIGLIHIICFGFVCNICLGVGNDEFPYVFGMGILTYKIMEHNTSPKAFNSHL
jgi:hypothetical protein